MSRNDASAHARPGEVALDGPVPDASDAGLVFIGRVRSAHRSRADCPKNMARAREGGAAAGVEVFAPWRPALEGLAAGRAVFLLTFLHEARRDLLVQMPRHAEHPTGTFALRSPVRPNPIGLHLVRLTSVDRENGVLGLDAVDVLDGTPLLDIKPWFETVDVPPPAEAR
jgi:tRNA (adenine37-N6)-methyltransferase